MAQVYVKYNPYKIETKIRVNGKEFEEDNILYEKIRFLRRAEPSVSHSSFQNMVLELLKLPIAA